MGLSILNIAILGAFGPWQVVAILVVVLLLFGGKKIPQLMKGLGQGMKEFKDASKSGKEDSNNSDNKEIESDKA